MLKKIDKKTVKKSKKFREKILEKISLKKLIFVKKLSKVYRKKPSKFKYFFKVE